MTEQTLTKTGDQKLNQELLQASMTNQSTSGELVPISETEVLQEFSDVGIPTEMQPRKPKALSDEDNETLQQKVSEWLELVKSDPASLQLSSDIYQLGTEAANEVMPHTKLYDTMISGIMGEQQKGPVEGTRDYNLLQYKQHMDLVNPAILAKQPIPVRFVGWLGVKGLPGADKVLDIIYENKETVKTAVDGLKLGLMANSNQLDAQLADLIIIYNGLRKADALLKNDIYFGQLLHVAIHRLVNDLDDGLGKQNLETVLADLTTQVNSLLVEENMYTQFFAGSQQTAKMVRYQQNQLKQMVRLMENAVLANLGLKVVANSLAKSVDMTAAMGNIIADTMADTGHTTEKTSEKLRNARIKGNINLDKLKEGMEALERTFIAEANANKLIIEKGVQVSQQVSAMTDKLEAHLDNSENSMSKI
jgi:hypothetical protein